MVKATEGFVVSVSSVYQFGEDQIIAKFRSMAGQAGHPIVKGIGDDCAVLQESDSKCLLLTTDQLIENIHFDSEYTPAEIGWKALATNLSDVAAMGGLSRFALLSIALPKVSADWWDSFLSGFFALANQHDIKLIGGDTTASKAGKFVHISLIGESELSRVKYRSAGQPGDFIFVTGTLGDTFAVLNHRDSLNDFQIDLNPLIGRLRKPQPHCHEGLFLGRQPHVHALIDISDGLATDLNRLCLASSGGARIDIENLPLSPQLSALNNEADLLAYQSAWFGGEDYVLLGTVAEAAKDDLRREFELEFGRRLYIIGQMESQSGVRPQIEGNPVEFVDRSFKHFG